jgi:histidinol-phosphate phosphatase family protein
MTRASGDCRPAAFLDRDGTLTVERGYVIDPNDLELERGAAEAVARLNAEGVLTVVVSNQSGVARGLMTEEDLAAVHGRLVQLLGRGGAALDGAYYAPNLPGAAVPALGRDFGWRKPGTGMVETAVRDLDIDLSRSAVFGDQRTDIELARRLGIPGVLVRTGKGGETEGEEGLGAAHVADDIQEAVEWFLRGLADR